MNKKSNNDGSDNAFLIQSSEKEEILPSSEKLDWLDKNELAIQKFLVAVLYFDNNINSQELLDKLDELRKLSDENSRILYSFITNFIYALEIEKYDIFINKLRNFTLNFDRTNPNFEILLRIYDHCHLAIKQKEYYLKVNRNFSEMDSKLQDNIKSIQKNNVTILGIFTSIVATFFGLSTFSASIFNNIMNTNFFKLIVVSSLVGLFFYGTIHLFINFIAKIININIKYDTSVIPILLFLLILVFTFLAYAGALDAFSKCLLP